MSPLPAPNLGHFRKLDMCPEKCQHQESNKISNMTIISSNIHKTWPLDLKNLLKEKETSSNHIIAQTLKRLSSNNLVLSTQSN